MINIDFLSQSTRALRRNLIEFCRWFEFKLFDFCFVEYWMLPNSAHTFAINRHLNPMLRSILSMRNICVHRISIRSHFRRPETIRQSTVDIFKPDCIFESYCSYIKEDRIEIRFRLPFHLTLLNFDVFLINFYFWMKLSTHFWLMVFKQSFVLERLCCCGCYLLIAWINIKLVGSIKYRFGVTIAKTMCILHHNWLNQHNFWESRQWECEILAHLKISCYYFFFFCNEIENKYHYYDLCQSQVFTGCGRSKLPHNDGFIWLTVLFRCFLFTFHSIYALNSMAETVEKAYFTSLCDDGDVRNFTEMTISHSTFALHCWPR